MWVTVNRANSTKIDDAVVARVLNIYPEEALATRAIFKAAVADGSIEYDDLKSESEKILIPWQMFFLNSANFSAQVAHIEAQRQGKVSAKLMAKRKGAGDTTSKRIVDRLIRLQNYLTTTNKIPANSFCGSLKGIRTKEAAESIITHFSISRRTMWGYRGKGTALEYLIGLVEDKNINISRGVLSNKLLPMARIVPSDVYRSTSGFAIKDTSVPFIFLPSEINPDEVESRQIYTLIYLLAVIGLEQYDYFLGKDFKAKLMTAQNMNARLHAITTELLIPTSETDTLRGQNITIALRDDLAAKFKVSPLALVVTLKMRGVITKKEFDTLKPAPFVSAGKPGPRHSPKVSTSVEKFCGRHSFTAINAGIRGDTLKSIPAQYLIFGAVNKKGYKRYRNELGI